MAIGTLTLAWLLLAPAATPPDVIHINKLNFKIPIHITDPARKAEIKELRLFVSEDQGATWKQTDVATPDKDGFQYYARSDGQYWFSVQILDPQDKLQPPDIYKVPPCRRSWWTPGRPACGSSPRTGRGKTSW